MSQKKVTPKTIVQIRKKVRRMTMKKKKASTKHK